MIEEEITEEHMTDFAQIMGKNSNHDRKASNEPKNSIPIKINVDEDGLRNGLAQLVMAVVKLLHELLERQAMRRMDGGSLSEEEIERVGLALMMQSDQIEHLLEAFQLTEEDLNLDLGPLGKLLRE